MCLPGGGTWWCWGTPGAGNKVCAGVRLVCSRSSGLLSRRLKQEPGAPALGVGQGSAGVGGPGAFFVLPSFGSRVARPWEDWSDDDSPTGPAESPRPWPHHVSVVVVVPRPSVSPVSVLVVISSQVGRACPDNFPLWYNFGCGSLLFVVPLRTAVGVYSQFCSDVANSIQMSAEGAMSCPACCASSQHHHECPESLNNCAIALFSAKVCRMPAQLNTWIW